MSEPVLRTERLTKRFGGLTAVDNLSFSLAGGRLHAIIGPNGAGKTTLFNLISGLFTPDADQVFFLGREITGLKPHEISRLGIDAFSGTTVRRMSGGQRRRVALAAALLPRPDVLFLDEPTAGLDPHGRLDVWDLVRTEADRGACLVVTTHSFEEAERVADRVVILASGRVVADGTLDAVRADRQKLDHRRLVDREAIGRHDMALRHGDEFGRAAVAMNAEHL